MRLQIWLHRLRGMRMKGFRKRRPSAVFHLVNACAATKRPSTRRNSPLPAALIPSQTYAETGLDSVSPFSLNSFDIGCPDSPRLSFSPISPLPSPALLNTPVECSNIVLKSPAYSTLLQNSQISASINRSTDPVSRNVGSFSVGCGHRAPLLRSSFRKAKVNLQALSASIRSFNLNERNMGTDSITGEHRTRLPASRTTWTGGAWCLLLNVEKGIVRARVVLKERGKRRGAGSHQGSAQFTPPSSAQRVDFWDRFNTEAPKIESGSAKRRQQEPAPGRKNGAINDRKYRSKSSSWRNFHVDEPNLEARLSTNSWPREQSSIASDEISFTSLDLGGVSESSNSSSENFEKNHNRTEFTGARNSLFHGRRGFEDASVEEAGKSSASRTTRKSLRAFSLSRSYPSTTTYSKTSDEDRLLLVTADSSAPDSPTRLRPGPPACKTDSDSSRYCSRSWLRHDDAAASPSSIDLEANAKAWAQRSPPRPDIPSNGPAPSSRITDTRPPNKHNAISKEKDQAAAPRMKSTRQDASATRRKYREAYGHQPLTGPHQDTIVLPREISKVERVALIKPQHTQTDSKLKHLQSSVQTRLASDSLAVEKCSQDPYVDFRDSMVDMILEKEIYESHDLEELLQSFLSLNTLEHHDLIVEAFSEVWEKVFGGSVKSPIYTSL